MIVREAMEDADLPKEKWVQASPEILNKYREDIFKMIQDTYKPIGGHHDFKSASDIGAGDADFWEVVDVDDDAAPDAVSAAKTTSFGKKSVVGANDGTKPAKSSMIKHKVETLNGGSFYAEISERLADILLAKGVPVVNDPEKVKKVLKGKEIEWIGEMPGKQGDGWYRRSLGGSMHEKILVGMPKT